MKQKQQQGKKRKQPITLLEAYAICQSPERCDLRDPTYIHFPRKEVSNEQQKQQQAGGAAKGGGGGSQVVNDIVGRIKHGVKNIKDVLAKSVYEADQNQSQHRDGAGAGAMKGYGGGGGGAPGMAKVPRISRPGMLIGLP